MTKEILKSEGKLSHLIKVVNNLGFTFHIPVVDVRDGENERAAAKNLLKSRGSKYMKPSFAAYGDSYQMRGTVNDKKIK